MTHRISHLLQSSALLGLLALQAGVVGWLLGGPVGTVLAIVFGVALAGGADRISSRAVLRQLQARRIPYGAMPGLHETVRVLSTRAGLARIPTLALIDSPVPNAVTVGARHDPVIGITRGLLQQLPSRELAGVLAHEISHVAHGDLRVLAMARAYSEISRWAARVGLMLGMLGMLFGAPSAVSVGMVLVLGAPASTLVMLAVSRQREFAADGLAAELTGDPAGLAHALRRIEASGRWLARRMGVRAPGSAPDWLLTHPATTARVERLAAA